MCLKVQSVHIWIKRLILFRICLKKMPFSAAHNMAPPFFDDNCAESEMILLRLGQHLGPFFLPLKSLVLMA